MGEPASPDVTLSDNSFRVSLAIIASSCRRKEANVSILEKPLDFDDLGYHVSDGANFGPMAIFRRQRRVPGDSFRGPCSHRRTNEREYGSDSQQLLSSSVLSAYQTKEPKIVTCLHYGPSSCLPDLTYHTKTAEPCARGLILSLPLERSNHHSTLTLLQWLCLLRF